MPRADRMDAPQAMRPSKIGTKKLKGSPSLGSFGRPIYNISNLR